MNNYLALFKTGTINGVKVKCLPFEEVKNFEELETGACSYCAFEGEFFGCEVPCCIYERPDKVSVYFKKVE